MTKDILHKIISIFTVVILLLPIGVQLIHILEDHGHKVCDSVEIQHIHENELDCSFCHVQLNKTSFLEIYSFDKVITEFKDSVLFSVVKEKTDTYINFTFSRGPPTFIV